MKKFPAKNASVFLPESSGIFHKSAVFPSASHRCNRRKKRAAVSAASVLALPVLLFSLGACTKTVDYFDYVSELRSNILLAAQGNLSICVFAAEKESPYAADGIKRTVTPRAEIYLTAPTGIESYDIAFSYDGQSYGGDMSFDNIRLEYFYSCSVDISKAEEIAFTISFEDTTAEITAKSIKTDDMLSPKEILSKVQTAESETFKALTNKNGFAGEIYLRLIYEENPYYYVGIIDREGKILALLTDSKDGKILAKREM